MSETISKLSIRGFKSIRALENFEIRPLNVLIGANGAGKSNFLSFFRLFREMIEQRLQLSLRSTEGGADACLYLGPKVTKTFDSVIWFGTNGYKFSLGPTVNNEFVFVEESLVFTGDPGPSRFSLGSGHAESKLKDLKDDPGRWVTAWPVPHSVYGAISRCVVYHFHETGVSAGVRRQESVNDNVTLRPSAENLAALLYRIRQTDTAAYRRVRDIVRLTAPFFDDFHLRPLPENPNLIQLEWKQKDSNYPFLAHQLSDGTLRFICLATALLQPARPATILFDEPELGLHPYALTLLGELVKAPAEPGHQIILSTQSPQLLSEFDADDIIVVERNKGESIFRRLEPSELSEWLQDYSLGELWQKNLLGGQPQNDNAPLLEPARKEP
jgi:predicted ATPase